MTPIIRKFVLKLLSKDRGSGITSIPGGQHRMIQESIITDTLLKKGVNPESITSEGMLQSILNGIKKEEAMIARSKAEAQKQLATVMDMKGRKIRPGAKIMGGEEVVETEAEIAERLGKGNKQAVENIKEKQLIESFDPDEMATGGRAGFAAGGMGRRAFLKLMAALGATGVAAKSGLVSLLGKGKGKQIAKELTEVPIKQLNEMPAWFKPLVNRVIKEGEDVTKQNAFKERMVVHKSQLPDSKTDIYVNQDLDSGDVWVDIGMEKHGFADGKFGQPVRLEYKASELIEPDISKTGKVKSKGGETKEEFWVEEAEFTGGHPENVKFEESTFEKFGNHESNFDEVEAFATGKSKKDARKVTESFDKQNEDIADHFSNMPRPDDYASGGRVPMWLGGGLSKGKRTLAELLKYMSKGSSHGKSPSEMLKMINPKQFNPMLDRPEGIPSIAKDMIGKYTKDMKRDRSNMIQDLIATGRKIKKVDDDLVNYKIKVVEDMVSTGMDRGTAKEMAETLAEMVEQGAGKKATPKITDEGLLELENIGKNLATKDRKLNASGGIARMLGE